VIETEAQSQSFLLADQALGLGGHAVRKHAGNYGPLTVHELFPSLTKTFLERHPCRVFSVSYEWNGRCHGRGRGFESRRPRHSFQALASL